MNEPGLTPAQSAVLGQILDEHGLATTLRAVAALARERAQALDTSTMADMGAGMRERWEAFGERIDALADSLLDVIDGGESRWGPPLWRKPREGSHER